MQGEKGNINTKLEPLCFAEQNELNQTDTLLHCPELDFAEGLREVVGVLHGGLVEAELGLVCFDVLADGGQTHPLRLKQVAQGGTVAAGDQLDGRLVVLLDADAHGASQAQSSQNIAAGTACSWMKRSA